MAETEKVPVEVGQKEMEQPAASREWRLLQNVRKEVSSAIRRLQFEVLAPAIRSVAPGKSNLFRAVTRAGAPHPSLTSSTRRMATKLRPSCREWTPAISAS